ncbi:NAD(P)H-hydrate epimerase, partial [Paracoccus binzhouensis]|uniref:NAD(P)H-hydrate epimerase n=1 Tax=Paracoccus binzhouensis TaxID=2796149 RepID=UPI002FCE5AB9
MVPGCEILTTRQMRAVEGAAIASGEVTGAALMERAGAGVVHAMLALWPECERPGRAVILCGPGNNGGDGYVVARLLAERGWQLRLAALAPPASPDAQLA